MWNQDSLWTLYVCIDLKVCHPKSLLQRFRQRHHRHNQICFWQLTVSKNPVPIKMIPRIVSQNQILFWWHNTECIYYSASIRVQIDLFGLKNAKISKYPSWTRHIPITWFKFVPKSFWPTSKILKHHHHLHQCFVYIAHNWIPVIFYLMNLLTNSEISPHFDR